MKSFLSVAGVAVLAISVWFELKWLPQDPPIPLAWALLVYGALLITAEIVLNDDT